MDDPTPRPTPERFFDALRGYQRTAVMKTSVDLDLFTAIDEGADTVPRLAARVEAAERGVRSLCDYLVVLGFLTKIGERYGLADDTAAFLSRRSPSCLVSVTDFILHPSLTRNFEDLTGAVRRGGGPPPEESTVATEWPTWVEFARGMAPSMAGTAEGLAEMLTADDVRTERVLDLAAGHGLYGIALAKRNETTRVTAVDWEPVLAVAREHAEEAGVGERLETRPGDVFQVDFGEGHDVVLLTNLLHHFDAPACETLLRKVRASLAPGGLLATVEFVPNEDRVSPPAPALFSLQMLAGTPAGDAYPFSELDAMLRNAGFAENDLREIPGSVQHAVLSRR